MQRLLGAAADRAAARRSRSPAAAPSLAERIVGQQVVERAVAGPAALGEDPLELREHVAARLGQDPGDEGSRHGPCRPPGSRASGPSGSGHGVSAGRIASAPRPALGVRQRPLGGADEHLHRRGRQAGAPGERGARMSTASRISRAGLRPGCRRRTCSPVCPRLPSRIRRDTRSLAGRSPARTPPGDPAVVGVGTRTRGEDPQRPQPDSVEGPVADELDDHLRQGHVVAQAVGDGPARRGSARPRSSRRGGAPGRRRARPTGRRAARTGSPRR